MARPLNESEAGVDFVLVETSLHFINFVNDAVLMLISWNFHKKSSKVSLKTRSTAASLLFKGQATKCTTVKWSVTCTKKPVDFMKDILKAKLAWCICKETAKMLLPHEAPR